MTTLPTSSFHELSFPTPTPRVPSSFLRSPCLFLPLHRWFLALALLDVIFTTLVLNRGGDELNALARTIIETSGLAGMVLFKLACVLIVLLLTELIGRHRAPVARRIALAAIAANTTAVTLGAIYLVLFSTAAYF